MGGAGGAGPGPCGPALAARAAARAAAGRQTSGKKKRRRKPPAGEALRETTADGLEICELMPKLAGIGKKFSVVRSVAGIREEHAPTQSDSGWSESDLRKMGGRPGIGSVISKVLGTSHTTARGAMPTFVDITGWTSAGFMGKTYAGYRPDGEARQNLRLGGSMTLERLGDRQSLLTGLDGLRRDTDASGMMIKPGRRNVHKSARRLTMRMASHAKAKRPNRPPTSW